MPYQIEGGGTLRRYTEAQLGEAVRGSPITLKSRDRYDVIVKDDNRQVVVISACSWHVGFRRVQDMVRAGVDPDDVYGVPRTGAGLGALGTGLSNVNRFLWWTHDDQRRLDEERTAAA